MEKKVGKGDLVNFGKNNFCFVCDSSMSGNHIDCIFIADGELRREQRSWDELYKKVSTNNQLYNCVCYKKIYYEKEMSKSFTVENIFSYVALWWNRLVDSMDELDDNKLEFKRTGKRSVVWSTLIGRTDQYIGDDRELYGFVGAPLSKFDLWKMALVTGQEEEVMSLWSAAGYNSLEEILKSPKQLWRENMSALECLIAYAFSYRDWLIDNCYGISSPMEKNKVRKEFPMMKLIHEISLSLDDLKDTSKDRTTELSKLIMFDYDLL